MSPPAQLPSWDGTHYRLVSLWDIMERFRFDKFIKAYQLVGALSQTSIITRQLKPGDNQIGLSGADYSELLESLTTLADLLDASGMPLSALSAKEAGEIAKKAIPVQRGVVFESGPMLRLEAFIKDMQTRVRDEFVVRYVLVVPPEKVKHYEPVKPSFGKDVKDKFDTVSFEIAEAGKCFALARYTATVFHLMRTLEVGIRAVARCLQIPDPTKPAERNWGFILKAIDGAIKQKKGAWSSSETEFFDGVFLALDKIRSLWRNPTMHVENKYLEEEASEILDAVRVFMRKLAYRLDEDGKPFA